MVITNVKFIGITKLKHNIKFYIIWFLSIATLIIIAEVSFDSLNLVW